MLIFRIIWKKLCYICMYGFWYFYFKKKIECFPKICKMINIDSFKCHLWCTVFGIIIEWHVTLPTVSWSGCQTSVSALLQWSTDWNFSKIAPCFSRPWIPLSVAISSALLALDSNYKCPNIHELSHHFICLQDFVITWININPGMDKNAPIMKCRMT